MEKRETPRKERNDEQKEKKDGETTDVNEEPAGPECAAWGASHEGKN